ATYRETLRDDALATAEAVAGGLGEVVVIANPSPAHALHTLADAERAALVVVGSTHTGRAGRVLPGSTGERLPHGSPCPVAIVPKGYTADAIRRIGVACNDTDEARAAVRAAAALALAFDAELELIGVASTEAYVAPALLA